MRIRFNLLLAFTLFIINGCQSQSRVFYEGQTHNKITEKADFTTLTVEQLADSGYRKIGMLKSEPTFNAQSVSKREFQDNPQKVLDSIAPENIKSLKPYYESLDKEVCRKAANLGGQLVHLEKIERTYPVVTFPDKAMAEDLTIKAIITVKHWSVWRREP